MTLINEPKNLAKITVSFQMSKELKNAVEYYCKLACIKEKDFYIGATKLVFKQEKDAGWKEYKKELKQKGLI